MRAMSRAVLASGIRATVLRPTMYLENLLQPHVLGELKTRGTFSYPPLYRSRKLSWTAQEDQAQIAVAALLSEAAIGKTFDIATPEAVTGEELAAMLSKKTGREIRYAPSTPDEFAAGMTPIYGEAASRMIAELYKATDSLPEEAR